MDDDPKLSIHVYVKVKAYECLVLETLMYTGNAEIWSVTNEHKDDNGF